MQSGLSSQKGDHLISCESHYNTVLCYHIHMPEPLDPNKFHVLTPKSKRVLLILLFLAFLASLPLSWFYYKFAVSRPAQTTVPTTIEIDSGMSVADIADLLYRKNLINSQGLFLFYVTINNLGSTLQAGVYTIPPGVSLKELVPTLQKGTKDVKITFLEGWRVEQFALKAAQTLKYVNYDDFVLQASSLEGYLFPDTYFVRYDISTEDLIDLLAHTFEDKTRSIFEDKAESVSQWSDADLSILASLVEREAPRDKDRARIAGILFNRLNAGMPLGVDATVQYYAPYLRADCPERRWFRCFNVQEASEVVWWPNDLTAEELSYDSPYNTRLHLGLPPTPIASFGRSALKAVVHPEETDYLYYISDTSGKMHYARTLEEHNRNVATYLR